MHLDRVVRHRHLRRQAVLLRQHPGRLRRPPPPASRRSCGSTASGARPSSARASVRRLSTSSFMLVDLLQRGRPAPRAPRSASRGAISERSTPARSTISGVLSSWLASAVKRRRLAEALLQAGEHAVEGHGQAGQLVAGGRHRQAAVEAAAVGHLLHLVHQPLDRAHGAPGEPVATPGRRTRSG